MPIFPTPNWRGRKPRVTSGFGVRSNGRMHYGVDLLWDRLPSDKPLINEYTYSGSYFHPIGIPAVAAMSGKVVTATVTQTGGYIAVSHGNGITTEYIHLKPGSFKVRVGQLVQEGQPLGEISGNIASGKPGLIHLHFQYKTNGTAVDPEPIIKNWRRIDNPWEIDLLLVLTLAAGIYALA